MSDVFEATIKEGQTYHSLEVAKNTKGYNWTVKVAGCDKEKVLQTLVELEKELKTKYGDEK